MLRGISKATVVIAIAVPVWAAAFDAASVRVSAPGMTGRERMPRENIKVSPVTLTMRNITLKACIGWAWHVMEYQVSGPGWIGSERYDVAAKAASPATEDELRLMLQTLLAERFRLEFHRQTKEFSVYLLVTGKNGPKFHQSQTEGESVIQPEPARMSVTVQRTPVSQLAEILSRVLQTPVLDKTGLTGSYDVTINVAKYIPQTGEGPPDLVSIIMTALQEELGLRLESKKVPLDLLIVDHAEKTPAEN